MATTGFVRITGWPGREVADKLTRWQKSHTAATAFRRLSLSEFRLGQAEAELRGDLAQLLQRHFGGILTNTIPGR